MDVGGLADRHTCARQLDRVEPDGSQTDFSPDEASLGEKPDEPFREDSSYDDDQGIQEGFWFKIYNAIFPDREVILWFFISLFFTTCYTLFHISTPGDEELSESLEASLVNEALVPLLFITACNICSYLCFMLVRSMLIEWVVKAMCRRHTMALALIYVVDPSIFYVVWSIFQAVLWQVLILRDTSRPGSYFILFLSARFGKLHLSFNETSVIWISCSIYLYVILSLRLIGVSVISFIFEVEYLMASNDLLVKYLKQYTNFRRFNLNWISYVLGNDELIRELHNLAKDSSKSYKLFTSLEDGYGKDARLPIRKFKGGIMTRDDLARTAQGFDMPSNVTESYIEESSNLMFRNWMFTYCVTNTSPRVALLHQEVTLKDKEMAKKVASLLFEQMYHTTSDSYHKGVKQAVPAPEPRARSLRMEGNLADEVLCALPDPEGRVSNFNKDDDKYTTTSKELQNLRENIADQMEAVDSKEILVPEFKFSEPASEERFLCRDRLSAFISQKELDFIFQWLDISGHGKITSNMLQQGLLSLYDARKKFKHNFKGNQGVNRFFKRILSLFSWVLCLVSISLLTGITAEAIVVSGATLMSSLTVALSYLYTNFITSVIFLAFSNPFNVGDRVRLDDGEPLNVHKMKTYTTEFTSMHGKILIYQNAILSTMKITNESRSTSAVLEITFKVDFETTRQQIKDMQDYLIEFVNKKPNDYVKDKVMILVYSIQPGHYFELGLWCWCVESWENWKKIYQLRTELMETLLRYCKGRGVGYRLATQPLAVLDQVGCRVDSR